jgi:hypothetical protein
MAGFICAGALSSSARRRVICSSGLLADGFEGLGVGALGLGTRDDGLERGDGGLGELLGAGLLDLFPLRNARGGGKGGDAGEEQGEAEREAKFHERKKGRVGSRRG